MRKSRRIVVALAVSGLVAAGGITTALVAHANFGVACDSTTSAPITCTISDSVDATTFNTPTAIQASVTENTGSPAQFVLITYKVTCSQGGTSKVTTNPTTNPAQAISVGKPVTETLTLGFTNADTCTVNTLTATLYSDTAATTLAPTGSFRMALTWTPSSTPSSATPTPTPSTSSPPPPPPTTHVSLIRGIHGKCLDAKGNSSRNRTPVVIWSCNSSSQAQNWKYAHGELVHHGKCADVQGSGGSGSKVILWTCNRSPNETWFHSSTTGEFVLATTSHGLMCLTDPGSSRKNGTQLIVSACRNAGNQRWS